MCGQESKKGAAHMKISNSAFLVIVSVVVFLWYNGLTPKYADQETKYQQSDSQIEQVTPQETSSPAEKEDEYYYVVVTNWEDKIFVSPNTCDPRYNNSKLITKRTAAGDCFLHGEVNKLKVKTNERGEPVAIEVIPLEYILKHGWYNVTNGQVDWADYSRWTHFKLGKSEKYRMKW